MKTIISLCDVDECRQAARALSLCYKHYQRFKKHGTTDAKKMLTEDERFWMKVRKTKSCWHWEAATYSNGYGHFGLRANRGALAHRYSWESAHGRIDSATLLDHMCHNRLCVNPEHLRVATQKQNLENMGVLRRDNTSGARGVYRTPSGSWGTRVQHHGVEYRAGTFADMAEAKASVVALRNKLFTHNDMDRRL